MKQAKGWSFLIGILLVAAGLTLVLAVFAFSGWDLGKLNTTLCVSNSYDIEEPFAEIRVKTTTAAVRFAWSSDGTCRVACYENEKMPHTVAVEDGCLTVSVRDERKWMDHFSLFSVRNPEITVFLPQNEYVKLAISVTTGSVDIPGGFAFGEMDISCTTGSVKSMASVTGRAAIVGTTGWVKLSDAAVGALDISLATGNINLRNVSCAENADLRVTTGKTQVSGMTCGSFASKGTTGDLVLEHLLVEGGLSATRSTGDVKLESCDAGEITITTDTGDITGTLLSEKVFSAKTDTGRVHLPQTFSGGKCSLSTDTGDIQIMLK